MLSLISCSPDALLSEPTGLLLAGTFLAFADQPVFCGVQTIRDTTARTVNFPSLQPSHSWNRLFFAWLNFNIHTPSPALHDSSGSSGSGGGCKSRAWNGRNLSPSSSQGRRSTYEWVEPSIATRARTVPNPLSATEPPTKQLVVFFIFGLETPLHLVLVATRKNMPRARRSRFDSAVRSA